MEIKRLQLVNFRNYRQQIITFNKKINIFIGNNAQGKTSLLESLYVLSISKSHKTNRDKEMVKFHEPFAKISATLEIDGDLHELEFIISDQGKKAVINGVEKPRISDYIGFFNVVMFAPEDLDIVKGDPQQRRKFLDIEIGQTSRLYVYELAQYNRLLRQRNEYLKQYVPGSFFNWDYLDVLNQQLAKYGARIHAKRLMFIEKLNRYASILHHQISNHQETLDIHYESSYQGNVSEADIYALYKSNVQEDLRRGVTTLGIHRDDLIFYVNGIDVSRFGSQGQQRTAALAVKLSLIDFIKDAIGHYPIVLLDDVLSELDDTRQSQLLDCIQDRVQTFVTTTNIAGVKHEIIKYADLFHISQGQITRIEEGVVDGK